MGFFYYICGMIPARVIKLKNIKEDKKSLIDEGQIFEGVLFDWPELDKSIYLYRKFEHSYQTILTTTMIKEIINKNTFVTRNSIYKVITKEEEREELLSSILD